MASKNLIIGGYTNYGINQLKPWVLSAKEVADENTDVVLVYGTTSQETLDWLTEQGVLLWPMDQLPYVPPHVMRFHSLYEFMRNKWEEYDYVVTTDVKDVYFQTDPFKFLEGRKLIIASEGLKYKDEPWGNKNILESFGPFYHNILKDELIYNVGVIAGDFEYVKGLLSLIFQLSINRPIPIVDQAVYNYILHTEPFKNDTNFTSNINNWAIQLGTALQAVQAGSGDLGQSFISSEEGRKSYLDAYQDHPVIIENGIVKGLDNTPYVIVHQYDRVPELASEVRKLYGDNDATESRTIFYHPV